MRYNRFMFFHIVIGIFYFSTILATTYNTIGNNTTNFVATNATVQAAARGFVYFTTGIIFDGSVSVSLPVPISGNVQFGNGTTCKIILESDLTLGSTAGTSTNYIKINTSNGYAEIDGKGGTISLNGHTFLQPNSSVGILSNVTIDGKGHNVIFGNLMTFIIQSGATLTIQNANLHGLNTLNFLGTGTLVLNNSSIVLDYDWTYSGNASNGTPTLICKNNINITGVNKKFMYAGGRNMVLDANASLIFNVGTTFSWACHRRNGFFMGQFSKALLGGGSRLEFDHSNFAIPSRGIDNGLFIQVPSYPTASGSLVFSGNCAIYNDGNTNINKSLKYDVTSMYILDEAQVSIDGYLYDNPPTGGYTLPANGSTVALKCGTAYLSYINPEAQSVDGSIKVITFNGTSSSAPGTRFILTVINPLQGSFRLTTTDGRYLVEGLSSVVGADSKATVSSHGVTLFYDWGGHIWTSIDPTLSTIWYPSIPLSNLIVSNSTSYAGWTWGAVAYWRISAPTILRNHGFSSSPWIPATIFEADVFTFEVI